MFENKKSDKYLRYHNILKEDEEYVVEIPVTSAYVFKANMAYRRAKTISIVCMIFGLLLTPIGLIVWLCSSSSIGAAVGLIILIAGIVLLAKATFILVCTPRQVHHFITTKRVYFNINIHQDTYEQVDIDDLQVVEAQMQPYTEFLGPEKDDEREFFLCFIKNDGHSMRMEVADQFLTDEQFYGLFPKPDIVRDIVLPSKLSTTPARRRRRRDRDDYYDDDNYDNEYNDYDDDYDNDDDNNDNQNN